MKRLLILCCIGCLLLCGCQLESREDREPVLFYYRQAEFVLGEDNGSIAAEERDGTGHITDMNYLLRLYLTGPLSEDLVCPFPSDVQLSSIRTGQGKVTVTLTGSPEHLPEAQKTLACACLTLTCLDITDANEVTVLYRERSLTMTRDSLTLIDESTVQLTTEETK